MLDHITFGVSDAARSRAFYDRALAPLGITRLVDVPKTGPDDVHLVGYGDDRPRLWLVEDRPVSGLLHIALCATTRTQVAAFHAAALQAGGRDNGGPGLRPHYHAEYYAAFVRDPDGHNIEAVCHRPRPDHIR